MKNKKTTTQNIIDRIWYEGTIEQMASQNTREAYEASAKRLAFTPLTDEEIIAVDGPSFWYRILPVARKSKDPTFVAAVAFTENRRIGLALAEMDGTVPVSKQRSEPREVRKEMLLTAEAPWLRDVIKKL